MSQDDANSRYPIEPTGESEQRRRSYPRAMDQPGAGITTRASQLQAVLPSTEEQIIAGKVAEFGQARGKLPSITAKEPRGNLFIE